MRTEKIVSSSNSRTKAKVAFVGNFQYNSGSSNALLGYVHAGATLCYDVRVSEFGFIDDIIRSSVPVASRSWNPDLLVIVYESYPFLSTRDLDQIRTIIPRSKRIVIDPDGKYLEPRFSAGDSNHTNQSSYQYWTHLYDSLSDTILQPILGTTTNQKIKSFLYFGIDKKVSMSSRKRKDFDLIYVGNNWYRWQDIYWLIKAIKPIRSRFKSVALFGQYWLDDVMTGYEEATYSDPDFLRQNHIEVYESAPYGKVEETMSRGLLNPILMRPILNKIGFLTPRMFETLAASTVPLIPKHLSSVLKLYGSSSTQFTISDNPAADIFRILDNYNKYQRLSRDIREVLRREHSYEVRLNQLLKFA